MSPHASLRRSFPLIARAAAARPPLLNQSRALSSSSSFVYADSSGTEEDRFRDCFVGLIFGSVSGLVLASGVGYALRSAFPSCISDDQSSSVVPDEPKAVQDGPDHENKPLFLFGDSYRRKVFFNYEKRLRLRSSPEKVFEYFASHQTPEGELLMRPADLMRAVVPVFPPSESDLVREGHLRGERGPGEEIDREEFKKVMELMRTHNRQGAHHKDGLRLGLKVGASVEDGGLLEFFFGKDGKLRLQHGKFIKFLKDLHDEILKLEFAHYDYKLRGTISATDFALSMVASADMTRMSKFLDRVDELNNEPHFRDVRITLEEFKAFAELRKQLQPLSLAIFSFGKVHGSLTKEDFKRAASHVCGIPLTENVVDIIFHVFDMNRDGSLSSNEFVKVIERRENDIAHPASEAGFVELTSCFFNCAKNCSFKQLLF